MSSLKMWETYVDLSGAMVGSVLVESARMAEMVKARVRWSGWGRSLGMAEEKMARERGKLRTGMEQFILKTFDAMSFMKCACGRRRAMKAPSWCQRGIEH